MILNDKQIARLAVLGMLNPFDSKCLNSYGYDIRLGREFLVPKVTGDILNRPIPLDPEAVNAEHYDEYVAEGGKFVVAPMTYLLGRSEEYVVMPPDFMAVCMGRSTYARCGIVAHVTPLEAGWCGDVTIEISNVSNRPVVLHVGRGIVQAVFFRGDPPARGYVQKGGRYQGQRGVTLPKGKL